MNLLMLVIWMMVAMHAQPTTASDPAAPGGVLEGKTQVLPESGKSAAVESGTFKDADALLDALETADADLRRLSAKIRYDRTFALAGDRQVRMGELNFISGEKREGRKFAVRFDTMQVGESLREEVKQYVFDGQWLVEKTPSEKRFVKRQVVPPGEKFDPLRVGEGFMPIPIGQKKADILARYTATIAPAEEGLDDDGLKKQVIGCTQLKLTPRADLAEEDQFAEIRLWYRSSEGKAKGVKLVPLLTRAVNIAEDVSLVWLIDVRTNADAEIATDALDTTTPSAKDGWEVIVRDYREGLRNSSGAPAATVEPQSRPETNVKNDAK